MECRKLEIASGVFVPGTNNMQVFKGIVSGNYNLDCRKLMGNYNRKSKASE